jgi:methionyl aminopeptidase
MISALLELHTPEELEVMRMASQINLGIIFKLSNHIRVGISTKELDSLAKQYMQDVGVEPAFFNYQPSNANCPFTSHACWCINEEVFHAPGSANKIINKGDLVTIDQGIKYNNLYSDCADTFLIGDSDSKKLKLIEACRAAIQSVLPLCVPGNNVKDLTKAIDMSIRSFGFAPVDNYGGHGIGTKMHMAPFVGNSNRHTVDCELAEGMTLAIEPACSLRWEIPKVLNDGWTVSLSPGNLSAHVERIITVTKDGGIMLV